MIEVACVFDKQCESIYWHDGSSDFYIKDSSELWNVIWENRLKIGGIAHTHLHSTSPSSIDITTFKAIEDGLGKILWWPIVTAKSVGFYRLILTTNKYVDIKEVNAYIPFFDNDCWREVLNGLIKRSKFLGEEDA
jgi:hypothetical protein